MRTAACILVGAFAAAGCGSRERVIPFRSAPPQRIPIERNVPAIPRGARRCRPPAARLVRAGGQGVNSVTMSYYVTIENRGRDTCVVVNDGAALTVPPSPGAVTVVAGRAVFDPGYPPSLPPFGLGPGRRASATVLVEQACRTLGKREIRLGLRLSFRFFPPVTLNVAGCAGGTTIVVDPLLPPPRREPSRRRWPLRAELELPSSARAGRPLEFRVRLTNVGARPFRFPWCPDVEFTPGKNVTTLNCRPMGTLDTGASALFEMRGRLPRTAARTVTVEWRLMEPDVVDDLVARGRVDVR